MTFEPDPRLAEESVALGDFALCRVLLRDDRRYPWLVLVPRRAGLVELVDLDAGERDHLMAEIAACSEALLALKGVQKINVGALGNIVRQLHIHVVGRRDGDPGWPGPVWGFGTREPYDDARRTVLATRFRQRLGL